MNTISIIGTGATPVGEHFGRSMADLATEALRAALGSIDPARISRAPSDSAFAARSTGR